MLLLALSGRVKAEAAQEVDRYQTYMDELDLQSIQNTVDELLPQDHLNFRQMITKLCQGGNSTVGRHVCQPDRKYPVFRIKKTEDNHCTDSDSARQPLSFLCL